MKILAILTTLLLLSTLICGLWLRYSGQEVTPESVNFHVMLAGASVLAGLALAGGALFAR